MPSILIDVWTRLHKKSMDDVDRDVQARFTNMAQKAANNFAKELDSASPRIRKAASGLMDANSRLAASNKLLADSQRRVSEESKRVADLEGAITDARRSGAATVRDLAKNESELVRARRDLSSANRQVIRDTDEFERSVRRQHLALKSLDEARRGDRDRRSRGGSGRSGFGGGQGGNALGGIFTSIPFVPGGKAGAVIGSGLVATLGSVADAAVTASQSLWLLPAAASAGGAAFLTLKLGMSGFDRALKDMGDAKKFAQDLAGLAPAAQQAALEIQKLVSGMDGLKMVTQNALFRGVATQLAGLGQTFMPEIKKLTTGVAGAFNEMFQTFAGQLRTPGTSAAISDMINNIVAAFHNLAPAMAPIVDAFTKIAKVGSDFLPGMATAFANLATKFANFITQAQHSGKLQEWIQKGIDAAATLGHVIGELAHKVFDVFGNKNPDQFKSTLEGMVGAAVGVAQAIEGISQVVNNLVRDIQPVAQALGGWPNLIQDVIAVWAEWKVASMITQLMKISEILGVTLPASAEAGATGISAALSRVAIPAWLMTLMALWNMGGSAGPGPNIPGGSPMGPQSSQALGIQAKENAGQAYAKDHGGQMPPGYMDWLKGGKMPQGMDKYYTPPAAPGTPFFDSQGRPLDAQGKPFGSGPVNPTPYAPGSKDYAPAKPFNKNSPGWYDPFWDPQGQIPVPGVPGKKGKLPKSVSPLDPSFGAPPRPGETQGEYAAEGALMQAKHRKADDEATLQEMEKDNNATAEQIQAQKNKIIQDQREIYKAELELQNAQDAANKKQLKGLKSVTDGMKDIGPKLDEDFGLSQGLAGLAKNLVEFVATLAAAPLLGQLAAVKAGDPFYTGGYGALGIMAEQNHMQGRSGLLGIPAGQPGGPSLTGLGRAAIGSAAFPGAGNGAVDNGLTAALQRAGIDPRMYPMLQGFAKAEGNNPSGVPTLGFADSKAGSTLDGHAQALGAQIRQRQSVAGPFPANGSPQDQAAWMATIVGQNGVGDQPSRQSYIDSIVRGFGGGVSPSGLNSGGSTGGGGGLLGLLMNGGQGGGVESTGYGSGGYAGDGALLSRVPSGRYDPSGDLIRGLGDCSSAVEDLVNIMDGRSTAGRSMSTGNEAQWLTQHGFMPTNVPMPGTFQVGFNPHHTQATLPGGTNFNWGSDSAAANRGIGGTGAWDPAFTSHFYRPVGGGPGGGGLLDMFGGQGGGIGPSPSMPGVSPAGYGTGQGGGLGPNPNLPGPAPMPGPGGGTPGFPMPGGVDEGNPTPQGSPKGQGWQPAGGEGLGLGGMPAAAITSAAGMFPGGGAAAQLAMKLANRTIQQAGEYTAIGIQGLQETFGVHDPDGGGNGLDDIGNNIFGRVLKGMAKAKPATGTAAGKTPGKKNEKDKNNPQDPKGQQGQQGDPKFQGGLHVHGDFVQAPGQNPQTTVNDLSYMGALGASTPLMA